MWGGTNRYSHRAVEITHCFDFDPGADVCKLIDHNSLAGTIHVESGNGVVAAIASVLEIYTIVLPARKWIVDD